jgi:hypothetical protein
MGWCSRLVLVIVVSTLTAIHSWAADPLRSPMPTDQIRFYEALSNHTPELLGDMELNRTLANFSKLSGEMQLRYAGTRTGAGIDDAEFTGEVYQVANAEEFFALNRGKNGFCPVPVRWLTVRDLGATRVGQISPSLAQSIRVGMLTILDWHDYDPSAFGACSGATFKLRSLP